MKSENLKILVVEDELLIAEMLEDVLIELDYEVVGKTKSFESTFILLDENPNINFIFLDINLSEEKTGFDIAKKLNEEYKIPFLFLTSYSDAKTIQSAVVFKPEAYLMKPFSKSELFITLELFKSRNFESEKIVEIKDGHYNVKLKQSDILWIKSENIYLEIKTSNKTYIVRASLDKFIQKLENSDFIKIHRSYFVNINHIKAINRLHIIVEDQKLPISRMHHDELVAKFSK